MFTTRASDEVNKNQILFHQFTQNFCKNVSPQPNVHVFHLIESWQCLPWVVVDADPRFAHLEPNRISHQYHLYQHLSFLGLHPNHPQVLPDIYTSSMIIILLIGDKENVSPCLWIFWISSSEIHMNEFSNYHPTKFNCHLLFVEQITYCLLTKSIKVKKKYEILPIISS